MNDTADILDIGDDSHAFYYDKNYTFYTTNLTTIYYGYGHINTYIRIIFVLLARLGFLLVQLGTIPVENVYRITFYNIFEIANTTLSYIFIGYMLSLGRSSFKGWIGYTNNISQNFDRAIFGLSACLIGSGQISCFLIGRVHLVCSIFVTFLYCALYQPLLIHWIWSLHGWMNRSTLLRTRVSVKDYGGNLVIHLSSSLIGATGSMFLGRRLLKVKDLDEHSLAREHSGNTITGQMLILLGYIAFNLPSPLYEAMREPRNYMARIIINNVVAFSIGIMVVCLLHLIIFRNIYNYWTVVRCFQGGIAGVISIAAAVDVYTYLESMIVAIITSILYFFFAILIHNTALEDNCNLISSHFISSIVGTLACALIAHSANFSKGFRKYHLLWQLICFFTVLCITLLFSWIIFLIFTLSKLLRHKEEVQNHKRAVTVQKYLAKKGALGRLFMIDSKTDHIAPGDQKRKPYMHDAVTSTADV